MNVLWLTRQLPGIKFVDINFWDNRNRAWIRWGLITKVKHYQFLICWVKPKTRRKLRAAALHFLQMEKQKKTAISIELAKNKIWVFLFGKFEILGWEMVAEIGVWKVWKERGVCFICEDICRIIEFAWILIGYLIDLKSLIRIMRGWLISHTESENTYIRIWLFCFSCLPNY